LRPCGTKRRLNGLCLAHTSSTKGEAVGVFLTADAQACAKAGHKAYQG